MANVTIYTTRFCPYCVAAKRLLASLDATFEEIRLDARPELRAKLSADNGGWRTVPMIFVGDEFVGGFQDVMALHQKGGLVPKL